MTAKLTILIGISGSGKTQYAHSQWSLDPLNTLIINKDKIRELLFGYSEGSLKYYKNRDEVFSLEKEVAKYKDLLIREGLESGKHVIVDDRHLTFASIDSYRKYDVHTEIQTFNVLVDRAICNDRLRVRQVGDKLILQQFEMFKILMVNPKLKTLDFIHKKDME